MRGSLIPFKVKIRLTACFKLIRGFVEKAGLQCCFFAIREVMFPLEVTRLPS